MSHLAGAALSLSTAAKPSPGQDIFIVHGSDESAAQLVARYLERLDLTAVILHEKPNAGRTLIEKFEDYSTVGFAVVILTPDDVGFSKSRPDEQRDRARQNVWFELGFFIGRLSRERVCALYREGVEIPSDFEGVGFVSLDRADWKLRSAAEMKAAGIKVDLNKAV
ncbi:MAG: nucleotide-binding protein [Gemmatimonadales bacterium]|jgi:predicted nucleotide-binding protein